MNELVERVARAIMDADGDPEGCKILDYQRNRARAAIDAMRAINISEEYSGERGDLFFYWQGDNQKWNLLYDIGSGSGITRQLDDREEVIVRRLGDQYVVIRND